MPEHGQTALNAAAVAARCPLPRVPA
jgi:hypothetical protein